MLDLAKRDARSARAWLLLAALALACLLSSVDAEARTVRVSDERTRTTWAHVAIAVKVRQRPLDSSRVVARLKTLTYIGWDEVVLVLSRTTVGRTSWTKVRYPGFGSGTGWVRSSALRAGGVSDELIVVDRGRRELRAFVGGRLRLRVPVGVGAAGSPTPAGRTYLRERIVPARSDGIYGLLAYGLGSYTRYRTDWPGGGQVGLHGTNEPGLIPGRISNGCIRVRNADIRRLDRIVGIGTPVWVR